MNSFLSSSSSFIKFTPISGCRQEQAPACYLLEIDQTRILMDCGTDSCLDVAHLHPLKRIISKHSIDAIVISHASLKHIGGLPYVLGSLGLSCPVITTVPVHHLGHVTLYDAYQSYLLTNGSPPPEITLDHIDKAFEHITMLRFAQTFYLSNSSVMISAMPAGHTVGGAIWKIKKGEETVVYAPSFNHKRESHLDGAPFELISKPTLMITGSDQALQVAVPRKTRDEGMFEAISSTLKAGGNVLIPIDTASRSLEIIQLLENFWLSNKRKESLILLTNQSKRTLELSKGMLEWMGQVMMKTFENDRQNPFDLNQFKVVHSIAEVNALQDPKVVLSSLETLESGFSRTLFSNWATQTKSKILFLFPPPPGSLAQKLLSDESKSPKITLQIFEQVPLEGEELRAHHKAIEEERERLAAEAAFEELRRRRQAEEDFDVEMLIDGDEEVLPAPEMAEIDKITSAKALKEIYWTEYQLDWHNDPSLDGAECLDYPLLNSTNMGKVSRHQQYSFQYQRYRANDYGIPVDPDEFGKENEMVPSPEEKNITDGVPKEETKTVKQVPTKLINYTKEIAVRCQRSFIDFSGLVDGRSLKTILTQIDPKRIIFIGAPPDPTDYLYSQFSFQSDKDEFCMAPSNLETVRVSLASNTKQAFLTQGIIEQLQMGIFKDIELAYVSAIIKYKSSNDEAMDLDRQEDLGDKNLVLEAPEEGIYFSPRKPILVGDPRLNELRLLITSKLQVPAEFFSGDLVMADGRIRLRKEGDNLYLEGASSEAFYSVRDLIYSTVAIV